MTSKQETTNMPAVLLLLILLPVIVCGKGSTHCGYKVKIPNSKYLYYIYKYVKGIEEEHNNNDK